MTELKRVSFKVAKAIKEAGYPIEVKSIEEAEKLGWQGKAFFTGTCTCGLCPYVMEVWLWLWRENNTTLLNVGNINNEAQIDILQDGVFIHTTNAYPDPEEAIIAAIEYLVENDLIK